MSWLVWSLPGLRSTGLKRTSPASPHAAACMAWARPISPGAPSGPITTAELFDMFCALNGATFTPRRRSQRQMPAVSTLLPASDVVPATRRPVTFLGLSAATTAAAATAARPTFRESLAARRMCRWSGLGPSPRNGRVSVRPK